MAILCGAMVNKNLIVCFLGGWCFKSHMKVSQEAKHCHIGQIQNSGNWQQFWFWLKHQTKVRRDNRSRLAVTDADMETLLTMEHY